ncbi:MAG TPA: NrfD/PsrC family molybdoenzyme membrane anchor subunit, partial [Anaeromyxobacteraceae bacterium]|nr:NrfD/PsrC family molybdoenzyme membrane anchor subunit [Anaeromyxobacteraceae bacterium]
MDPIRTAVEDRDGRNVDPAQGILGGEGASQHVEARRERREHPALERRAPEAEEGGPSYYGMPVLKEPVWSWEIPAYFFTGGLAGASAVLGGAAMLAGGVGTAPLVRRCRLVAAGSAAASAALLISDLGRPGRFLAMMRVFRPSSPMNMGTWLLAGFGALSSAAALPAALGRPRGLAADGAALGAAALAAVVPLPAPLRRAGDAAGLAAAALGLPLVGYTGVLLANTAVPVWQSTRNTLPILFAFSGAVSAGALFDVWRTPGAGGEMAHRFGLVAKGAEIALSGALHREAGAVPRVERALRRGRGGALLQAARVLLGASALLDLLPGRS